MNDQPIRHVDVPSPRIPRVGTFVGVRLTRAESLALHDRADQEGIGIHEVARAAVLAWLGRTPAGTG